MISGYRFTKEEFDALYSQVPRLSVEVILNDKKKGLYMTERDIEPCKGQWHLPGGTVFFGERLLEAVRRVAKRELDIEVQDAKLVGYIEYPSHWENGLDSPIGIAFEVTSFTGDLNVNSEAS